MRYRDNPEGTKRLLSLANRMNALREAQGITKRELARASGLSAPTIQRFEEQGQPVNFTALYEMATVLGHNLEFRLKKTKE